VAAVVCLVAGVALAARWIARAHTTTPPREQAAAVASSRRVALHPATARAGAGPGEPAREPPAAPEVPASPATSAASGAGGLGGAATLFARATEARRAGRVAEASQAYERLRREFPATVEAETGLVAYARWLLDRGQYQPAAAAFGDSLRAHPQGTLAAEASVGLAESFEALHEWPQARQAWGQVLVQPSAQAFARHARARLRALEAAARDHADGEPAR